VVTSLVFRAVPAPAATSFHLIWPHTQAVAVIEAWQDWAPSAPDDLAASLLVTASPDLDRPPVVNLFGAMLGTEAETDHLLDELVARTGAGPTSAARTHGLYRETKRHLAEHAPGEDQADETWHAFSKSEFFERPLPTEAIAALVGNLARARLPDQYRELDFTPWGGAYNRVRADATAFVHRDELFLLKHAVVLDPSIPAAGREAAERWLSASWGTVHPWGSGGVYPNFPDLDLEGWAQAYYGINYERLLQVKASYDPDGFFRFEQSIVSEGTADEAGRSLAG
jgi:hypothetical protein